MYTDLSCAGCGELMTEDEVGGQSLDFAVCMRCDAAGVEAADDIDPDNFVGSELFTMGEESESEREFRLMGAALDSSEGSLESSESSGEAERARRAGNEEAWTEIAEFIEADSLKDKGYI